MTITMQIFDKMFYFCVIKDDGDLIALKKSKHLIISN